MNWYEWAAIIFWLCMIWGVLRQIEKNTRRY